MSREHPPSRVRASSFTMDELHYGADKSRHPDIAAANIRRILKTLVVVPMKLPLKHTAPSGLRSSIVDLRSDPWTP
jgi:hypothetical protein